jgi:hypothetical protein
MSSYSKKLRDPRWQKKRLEIFERDHFSCRVCGDTQSELHVHHTRYLKGREPWEHPDELMETRCSECHESAHKTAPGLRFYLAGKIEHTDWRHQIVSGLRDGFSGESPKAPILLKSIGGIHHYTGPFFLGCDHGCGHVAGHHGCHINGCTGSGSATDLDYLKSCVTDCDHAIQMSGRQMAFANAMNGIEQCDVLFAWIESHAAFGTLAEIGFAFARQKKIWISFVQEMDDLWFAATMDSFNHRPHICASAKIAFDEMMTRILETVGRP